MSYLDLARSRYSCREFENRSVEQAVVDAIVEAGRIAPSACNNHPARVMVLDTPELLGRRLLLVSLGLLVMGPSLGLRLSSLFAALPATLGFAPMTR
mgnify:CR=1 FL=1